MGMITLILGLSCIMWYVIDKFKPLWEDYDYGKYITIFTSAVLGFALSFSFNLDLVYGLGLIDTESTMGTIITALALMSGSSAISEIFDKIEALK